MPNAYLATFSIVARCPQSGELGIAVSTAIPAVGAINPFTRAGVGAIATQAWSNPYWASTGCASWDGAYRPPRRWSACSQPTPTGRSGS
jgi:uncharacterized Ntn-hydrolase superfamily protein